MSISGERFSGRGKGQCKGPEVNAHTARLVFMEQSVEGRGVGHEVRKVMGVDCGFPGSL